MDSSMVSSTGNVSKPGNVYYGNLEPQNTQDRREIQEQIDQLSDSSDNDLHSLIMRQCDKVIKEDQKRDRMMLQIPARGLE